MVGSDEVGKAVPLSQQQGDEKERGVPKFPQDQVCGTGVQEEEHGLPDTIMSAQDSLSEMMVVGSRKPGSLQLSMARP